MWAPVDIYGSATSGFWGGGWAAAAGLGAEAAAGLHFRHRGGVVASMVYPLLAYGVARGIYAYAANKPLNPIKAHDAGRWGREWTTSAIGSDFEPGASFVGRIRTVASGLKKLFTPLSRSQHAMNQLQMGFSVAQIEKLAGKARGMSVEEFARHMKVDIKKLPEWAIAATGGAFGMPARSTQWRVGKALTGKFGPYKEFEVFAAETGISPGRSAMDPSIVSNLRRITKAGMPPASFKPTAVELKEIAQEAGISVKHLRFVLGSRLPPAMKLGKSVQEQIQKTVIFHEAAEQLTYGTLASRFQGKELKRMILLKQAHKMVIPQEELFIRAFGGAKETRDFFQAFRTASDPWYEGFHSQYNTIKGLRDKGLAPQLRHILTEFGSGWRRSVAKIIEPFVKAALKKGMTLEKFAKMAQVNLMTEASTLYPIRKFRPGAGRTVLRKSGEVTAMMTSPKELSRRGYDMLNQKVRQKWMGGVVHERLEAEFFKRGTYGRELIRELGHAHKNVPRGHGYFLQQIGMKEAQLATFIPAKDLPLVLEGFKAAEQATLRSKSIMSMIDESLIEIRGIEAVRSKKLHQAAYQETSAGLSHVMNAQRVGHRDMGYI